MRYIVRASLVFVATILVIVIGVLVAFWAPDVPVEALKARWATPPSSFIAVNGMQVHIRDEGPKNDLTPIVLLHGTSASLHTWDGWVGVLAKERRVIRFDLPGFGLTGPAPDDDYQLSSYSKFVAATLDAIGVKTFILVGNSLGGNIAWASAASYPERVERLILVDAGGYAFQSESVPLGFRIAKISGVNRLMSNVLPRSLIEGSLTNVYGDPSKVSPALVDRYYDLARREGNRRALGLRFTQTKRGDKADLIPQLKMPTLIIWGAKDRLIPLENGQRFHREIAGSQLVIFDQLGHVPQEEDPVQTVAVASKFITAPN
ncbi:MAG: alpha/beta hydrolase [Rhodocyclaceae bacterium]|nr:alpha/beta hydrolase [Rhodocyclaceae bacterium]MBP6109672.1 alpha/beta hydrolase [Rhodocyclaceae bacterium]